MAFLAPFIFSFDYTIQRKKRLSILSAFRSFLSSWQMPIKLKVPPLIEPPPMGRSCSFPMPENKFRPLDLAQPWVLIKRIVLYTIIVNFLSRKSKNHRAFTFCSIPAGNLKPSAVEPGFLRAELGCRGSVSFGEIGSPVKRCRSDRRTMRALIKQDNSGAAKRRVSAGRGRPCRRFAAERQVSSPHETPAVSSMKSKGVVMGWFTLNAAISRPQTAPASCAAEKASVRARRMWTRRLQAAIPA